jgi:hypothetical protein
MVGFFGWECGGCRLHEKVHRLCANIQYSHVKRQTPWYMLNRVDLENTNLSGTQDRGRRQDDLSGLLELGPN